MKRLLRSPSLETAMGLAPWVPVVLIATEDTLLLGLLLSLLLSFAAIALTLYRQQRIRTLEIIDICYFGFFLVLSVAVPATNTEVTRWIAELAIFVVIGYMVITLVIKRPFTDTYTRPAVSPEFAASPDFYRSNHRLTTMWILAFVVQLASALIAEVVIGDQNELIFGWLIPVGSLVFGFTANFRMTRAIIAKSENFRS